jgi:hypothetical protein
MNHLLGKRPLGIYLLMGAHTRAVVIDYDTDDPTLPVEFVNRAAHYGIEAHIEVSKRKGFHVWVFFTDAGVPAAKARAVANYVLREIGHNAEVFPKQDTIDLTRGEYGNFINLPLHTPLVLQGRTVFVDPTKGLRPAPNQWEYLERMQYVPETLLDEIIEVNELEVVSVDDRDTSCSLGVFLPLPGTLPPCARRMLEQGVTANQRVSCFRLAVHLRKVGLPYDLAAAVLLEWSRKNWPSDGKTRITGKEVQAQTATAYLREYHGCGCEDPAAKPFCDPVCPVRNTAKQPPSKHA